jgi:S-adenosylmethionine:tRNA ribosyltransferase-isomerase
VRASDFDFELPPDRIASEPTARRDDARLLVLDRATGAVSHHSVRDLPDLVSPTALQVVNDARVIPARLFGRKPTGGRVELLLLEPTDGSLVGAPGPQRWRALAGSSKPMRIGPLLLDGEAPPACDVVAIGEGGAVEVLLAPDARDESVLAAIERIGQVPLPPYIRRETPTDDDRTRYQTVYARAPGSVAAPTAGLHFTPALLEALAARGVERAALTLHVGAGTFLPLRSDDVDAHVMHAERFDVPRSVADAFARARAAGRPVWAVGTTTVRTLESVVSDDGATITAGPGETRIFIRPGHRFRAVDILLTNFHLPRSTLIMLVAAFAGREKILAAYAEAIARGYRFYSYGDAMLIR